MSIWKWCLGCNSRYRGRYSICKECVKYKRRNNEICWSCKHPDCVSPVLRNKKANEVSLDSMVEAGIEIDEDGIVYVRKESNELS